MKSLLICAVIAALALTGCSGETEDDLTWPDPCKLLTERELALHANVPPGSDTELGPYNGIPPMPNVVGVRYCAFHAGTASVFVGVVGGLASETFDKYVRLQRKEGRVQTVADVGARAVWSAAADELVVLADDKLLAIEVRTPDEHNGLERARRLASIALERLA